MSGRAEHFNHGSGLVPCVAEAARVRCAAGEVFGYEVIDDVLLELRGEIEDVMGYAELRCDLPCVIDAVERTATAFISRIAADVFVLKLIPAGEKSQPGECFLPFEKKNAPADRYVVVMDEATVLAVASIRDVP